MSQVKTHATEVQKKTEPARQLEQEVTRQPEQGPVQQVAPQAVYRRTQMNRNRLRPEDLLALQRAVGNRVVQRMVARRSMSDNVLQQSSFIEENSGIKVQTKLAIDVPNNNHKPETDHIIQRFKDPYHEKMIKAALQGTGEEQTWKEVYFGSWLRDYSQILSADSNPEFKKIVIFILNRMAKEKFGLDVNEKRLGHYEAVEHMDNPEQKPPATDLPIKKSLFYIKQELAEAARLGRNTEGRIHFGQAVHVIQDFFSHSNFIQAVDQLCKAPSKKNIPLTSGIFTHKDKIVSILEMMVNFASGKINQSPFSLTPMEKANRWVRKWLPLPPENRIPGVNYQDPQMHPENQIWIEALNILKPKLDKARAEARSAAQVLTHSELHQDDPSRPLYQASETLAEHITHEVTLLMDRVWNEQDNKQVERRHLKQKHLDTIYKFLDTTLSDPKRDGWWKSVLESKGVVKCH